MGKYLYRYVDIGTKVEMRKQAKKLKEMGMHYRILRNGKTYVLYEYFGSRR